jgi:adenylate cyclase
VAGEPGNTARFVEAGLLDDLDEAKARKARLALLIDLESDGVSLEEMKEAVEQDRLAFLPVDRVLAGDMRYTSREVAELSGVSLDYLLATRQAMGLARPDPDERSFGEYDLEAARIAAAMAAAGLPEEGMLEITRVLGRGMAQGAEAIRMFMAQLFVRAGVTERDLAMRNAEAAAELLPQLGPLLLYMLRLHLLEQTRTVAVSQAELASGASPNARTVYVGFADIVGFTGLGERVDVDEVGRLVGRLADLAFEATQPPARVVKTIGDAVMFVAPTPEPLLETALDLVARAEEAGDDFLELRAGLAGGVALGREGDWYGPPVNLASRATGVARPGSVLATQEVREAAEDGYRWSAAGEWKLKGIKDRVPLYRVRRAERDPNAEAEPESAKPAARSRKDARGRAPGRKPRPPRPRRRPGG